MFMVRRMASDGSAAAPRNEFETGETVPGGGQRIEGIVRFIFPQGRRHGPYGPRGGLERE